MSEIPVAFDAQQSCITITWRIFPPHTIAAHIAVSTFQFPNLLQMASWRTVMCFIVFTVQMPFTFFPGTAVALSRGGQNPSCLNFDRVVKRSREFSYIGNKVVPRPATTQERVHPIERMFSRLH
jgi:hypothetical protein